MEYIDADKLTPETPVDGRKFIVVPYRALKDPHMKLGRLRVLMALCSYARPDGSVWPSVNRIAEDCGFTLSTVSQHITALTKTGYIKIIRNSYTVGSKAKPRRIIFDPEQTPADEEWKPTESQEQQEATPIETKQSLAQPLADAASLFVVWRSLMQSRFNITPPPEPKLYARLAYRHTLSSFEEAARVLLANASAPPASVGIMLR
jgi:DNA-binding transcriptional ArsR family regulator